MKIKETKTREQKDKAAKKGKQSLSSVTRRFRNFSISKTDLTPSSPNPHPHFGTMMDLATLACQDNA